MQRQGEAQSRLPYDHAVLDQQHIGLLMRIDLARIHFYVEESFLGRQGGSVSQSQCLKFSATRP